MKSITGISDEGRRSTGDRLPEAPAARRSGEFFKLEPVVTFLDQIAVSIRNGTAAATGVKRS